MVAHSEVAAYLLARGLLEPRDVVEGGVSVVDASRRHRVFIATAPGRPAYVIKQGATPELAHEASVLRSLAPELGGLVPEVVSHDVGLLVLRTRAGGRDWAEQHAAAGFPAGQARTLGRALAAVHGVRATHEPPEGRDPLWGLSLPEPPAALLYDLSAGSLDVIGRIQSGSELCARLDALRRELTPDGLAHGDLRWDNCVVAGRRALLVDWELAGRGVCAFDAGSVLAEYLRAWACSIPLADAGDPGRLVAHATVPLSRVQPAAESFWTAYSRACPRAPTMARVIELAAVRLLQIAVEQAREFHTATAEVMVMVQLAANLLESPDGGAVLLGLGA